MKVAEVSIRKRPNEFAVMAESYGNQLEKLHGEKRSRIFQIGLSSLPPDISQVVFRKGDLEDGEFHDASITAQRTPGGALLTVWIQDEKHWPLLKELWEMLCAEMARQGYDPQPEASGVDQTPKLKALADSVESILNWNLDKKVYSYERKTIGENHIFDIRKHNLFFGSWHVGPGYTGSTQGDGQDWVELSDIIWAYLLNNAGRSEGQSGTVPQTTNMEFHVQGDLNIGGDVVGGNKITNQVIK